MPFKSKAQLGYFMANKKKLEGQGVNVMKWLHATPSVKALPKKVGKKSKPQT